ncbi:glycosyltransferase [Planktothrix agardhii]|uniref:glycosyltransferase n=1 Tax=Planktothrix agardhii TaxID=1160 RepID=UPI001F43AC6C|nr:glycosyltransferase [Planktothrix agardhii]MCF3623132.1 glycosyltransferase [Planktothrix agardhii 1030]
MVNSSLGINIAGHVKGDFGLGVGVRANIRAIEAAGIPHVINNLYLNFKPPETDTTYTNFSEDNPYPINLVQTNPNMMEQSINKDGSPVLTPKYFQGRYNIALWLFELPQIPPEWDFAFDWFDEIWVMSNFCAEIFAPSSPIPVFKVNFPKPSLNRESLGWPKNKFIFLFMFDFTSCYERKNPIATIKAFKQAFGQSCSEDVLLVIKYRSPQYYPHLRDQMVAEAADCPSIRFIDGNLKREETNALVYNCDCYVSLHRAEGFGLTMAEAMFYAKPVIATAYSSNLDFMNVNNSFLVKYKLVTTTEAHLPYPAGSIWADPDIDHAASLMRYVFDNQQAARDVGARASREIKSLLGTQTVGHKIRSRLEYIMKRMDKLPRSHQFHKILAEKQWLTSQSRAWRQTAQQTLVELKQLR